MNGLIPQVGEVIGPYEVTWVGPGRLRYRLIGGKKQWLCPHHQWIEWLEEKGFNRGRCNGRQK